MCYWLALAVWQMSEINPMLSAVIFLFDTSALFDYYQLVNCTCQRQGLGLSNCCDLSVWFYFFFIFLYYFPAILLWLFTFIILANSWVKCIHQHQCICICATDYWLAMARMIESLIYWFVLIFCFALTKGSCVPARWGFLFYQPGHEMIYLLIQIKRHHHSAHIVYQNCIRIY